MKKTFISTFLFIIFIFFISLIYLSFYGYETDRFNSLIKSEIKKSNKDININFQKISVLLDIKKFTIFIRFINPEIIYSQVLIPLQNLRTDVDLEALLKKKVGIKRVLLSSNYIDFNEIKTLVKKTKIKRENLKYIKNARFKINNLELNFNEDFKLKKDFILNGIINTANIKISEEYEIKNLITNFRYEKDHLYLDEASWSLNNLANAEKDFFSGKMDVKKIKKNFNIYLSFKTNKLSSFIKIPLINYSFSDENIASVESEILFNQKNIYFKNLSIKNSDNQFKVINLRLNNNFQFINFDQISIKTSIDNSTNNEFKIINKDIIKIEGKVFDAKMLIKELSKDDDKNNLLKDFSKSIEIDFQKVLKGAKFPIKNFRLVGKIKNGIFEKISAKSDFSSEEHLDISLKKNKESNEKILEIFSDIATPVLSDYKFFNGLEGGNLIYVSKFDKNKSSNTLTVNNFKLNDAPALAKLLTLADLKGLTDSLKGEGITFDTLSIKYNTDPSTMTINEIFMIGPSISILIDGYIEKKSGLVSLRGTLVPAKTLNNLISKIPVVGEILVGKKIGEGIFGLSFKIKGMPDNLKTTVNPVKTLAPRFITRAVEAAKKRNAK